MFKRFILPAVLFAAAVVFTGCGGDDKKNGAGSGSGSGEKVATPPVEKTGSKGGVSTPPLPPPPPLPGKG